MKTIVLIRHAKSSWEQDITDLSRPLSKRGVTDAHLLSTSLDDLNFQPDAIFSSPANRALSTCSIFMENLGFPDELLKIEEQLYDFGGNRVLRFIKNMDDNLNQVMIFGHNHAFTELTNALGDRIIDNLPTSGLVMIQFEIDSWKDLQKGHTKMILKPKDLK
ncbi:SixA phosphatase family protein [Gelidibacter salicanalis]|uniref:Histidine phosphatase family protein n=1 Tax=Gelidibacter salicanalis TaxID=291193 RepID=A0A934KZW5_9FLAO|nr:histidine phosphatase family protein [Gelidibacter salicanalis]MBJ7882745.1 histidine phosphatase family protein [Gelidibacter salicanalis]